MFGLNPNSAHAPEDCVCGPGNRGVSKHESPFSAVPRVRITVPKLHQFDPGGGQNLIC